MNDKVKTKYVNQLCQVIDGATINGRKIIRPSKSGSRELNDDIEIIYRKIADDLFTDQKWSTKFSTKKILDSIDKIIHDSLMEKNNSDVEFKFENLISEYERFKKVSRVVIPLDGFTLLVPKLRIGNITLFNADDKYLAKSSKHLKRILRASPSTPKNREQYRLEFESRLNKHHGKVCAEFLIVAEYNRALERAHEEIELVIDILRWTSSMLVPHFHRIRIGLAGHFIKSERVEVVFSQETINTQTPHIGPRAAFKIGKKEVTALRTFGLLKLAKTKPAHSKDFLNVILRALHWHSRALDSSLSGDQVLFYTTSLECFFSSSQGEPIVSNLAEGFACILGKGLDNRMKLRKVMKDKYKLRSKISHTGSRDVTDSDARQLEIFSGSLISHCITWRKKFRTHKDFEDWVTEVRLGRSNSPRLIKVP